MTATIRQAKSAQRPGPRARRATVVPSARGGSGGQTSTQPDRNIAQPRTAAQAWSKTRGPSPSFARWWSSTYPAGGSPSDAPTSGYE